MRMVTRDDWHLQEFPARFHPCDYEEEFDAEEWRRIRHGYICEHWDDRWFMFCEGTTLYLYRSVTGIPLYRIEFVEFEGGARIARAERLVEEDHDGESGPIKDGILEWAVRSVLLRQEFPFPGDATA